MNLNSSPRVAENGPPLEQKHKGRDIPAWIVRGDGERFAFDRIARADRDGTTPLSQLRPDECVIAPGLIYRRTR